MTKNKSNKIYTSTATNTVIKPNNGIVEANSRYNKAFLKICLKAQDELKDGLTQFLGTYYIKENIIKGNGYIYAKGDIPCLLTAHMDTVHDKLPQHITEWSSIDKDGNVKHYVKSAEGIGGDDRCGIYIIKQILKYYQKKNPRQKSNIYPSVLFCEDEEIGLVGSSKFVKSEYINDVADNNKYLIELDRRGDNDCVFYDCGNEEFKDFIKETTGYKEAFGSCSDISNISPICDLASVNLSCGYYKEHTTEEYVCYEEMEHTIEATIKLIDKANEKEIGKFDYQEDIYRYDDFGWGSWTYPSLYKSVNKKGKYNIKTHMWAFEYWDNNMMNKNADIAGGGDYEECLFQFLLMHTNVCIDDIYDDWEIKDF